jgi:hypothetical protein
MATPLNPTVVPAVIYEHIFNLPSSEWPWPPAQRKAQRLLLGSYTLGTVGRYIRPNKSRYDSVPRNGT